jgi:hypothetical protein
MICHNPNCNNEIIGKRSDCVSCSPYCARRIIYLKNIDKEKQYNKKYHQIAKEKIRKRKSPYMQEYRLKNLKKIKKQIADWQKENQDKKNSLCAKRRAKLLKAIPKFANIDKIKEIYKNCPKGYHVDHIIPLNNPIVCGLHVEWNLQYLSAKDNCSKGNKLIF